MTRSIGKKISFHFIFIFCRCPICGPPPRPLNTLPHSPPPPPRRRRFLHPPNPTHADPHSRRWPLGACSSPRRPAPRQPAPSRCTPEAPLFRPALLSSL